MHLKAPIFILFLFEISLKTNTVCVRQYKDIVTNGAV